MFDDTLMNKPGYGSDTLPVRFCRHTFCFCLFGNKSETFLEGLPEGDVARTETFVRQMGVEERLEFIRSFGYGLDAIDQFIGLSCNAFCDVFEEVCDLILVPAHMVSFDDPLDVEESVPPHRVVRDGSFMIARVASPCGRVLPKPSEDPPVHEPPCYRTALPDVSADEYGLLQEDDEVRRSPTLALSLFGDQLAQVPEDAAEVGLEAVDRACRCVAPLDGRRSEGSP